MNDNIGVGLIVGLAIGISLYVWNSDNFTKTQKIGLICCVIFPPLQWGSILLVLAYNNSLKNNSQLKITEKKVDQTETKLALSISNLEELKEKGILTKKEYKEKIKKIETQKNNQKIKKLKEYKQLKSLLENNILTNNEFENKIKLLIPKEINRKIKKNQIFIIKDKTYTLEEIKVQFENGNYFINKNTEITLNDGSNKTIENINKLSFILEYFPPKL